MSSYRVLAFITAHHLGVTEDAQQVTVRTGVLNLS